MKDVLTGDFYLVARKKGYYDLGARLSLKKPSLEIGEVAIKLSLELPRALFTTPQLHAQVVIPESAVTAPVLDAAVLDNVKEVLEKKTGMAITVAVVDPEVQAWY